MIHTSLPPGPERGEVTLHVVNETSSVLTLCWVDDEGRLHCHYPVGAGSDALWSDDGSASNAHAESTFAGDAFVCFAADDDDVRDAAALTAACRQGRARLACSYVVADAPGDQVLTISEAPPPRWALWPRAEFAVVVCAGAAADVSAPGSGAPRAYAYARRVVAGFDVDVDVRLDAEPLWKLRELCADVEAAALKLPPGAAAELRRETRFVVHLETRGFRAMCYHAKGGGAWLRANGFDADWLAGAVCSGEECHRELGTAWRGKRAVFLGWERDADDAGYLEGTGVRLADVADADCLVAHGPDTILGTAAAVKTGFRESGEIGPYLEVLKKAAVRRLPMLVANPDQVTLQGAARQVLYMPGSIADAYRALGGDVIDFGKPSKALFDAAVDAAEWPTAPRVIHVGDSLKHDVHGARGANIDSLFVIETGVHRHELVDADGALRDDTTIAAVAASYGAPLPTHYCAMFKW
mmetsp:Transcript_2912/g.10438  ORF Transcript_2912/g.10438 Transcript_2912/m.10438 type:complete len:468 (-) Transcript_2912:272-1675(-)